MNEIPLFKPIESKRAFEEVAEQVKGLIYSGTLKPGDKLPCERELAAQFNVARMVVREANADSGTIWIRQNQARE